MLSENTFLEIHVFLVKLHVLHAQMRINVPLVLMDIGLIMIFVRNVIRTALLVYLKLNVNLVLMAITLMETYV